MFRYRDHNYFVYIITNVSKTVLYTGVTNDLERRLSEHYLGRGNKKTFAKRYYCHKHLYYEHYTYIMTAIEREKEIKKLSTAAKIALTKETNLRLEIISLTFTIR